MRNMDRRTVKMIPIYSPNLVWRGYN